MDVGLRRAGSFTTRRKSWTRWPRGGSRRRREQVAPAVEGEILALLARHDASALQNAFANLLMRQGLQRFVLEIADLSQQRGRRSLDAGELAVFEEHLYTEQMQVALRTGINAFPRQAGRAAGCC